MSQGLLTDKKGNSLYISTPVRTWRAFCVVMSPTIVRTPLMALMGTKSMPIIKLLIGMVFCAT